MQKEIFRLLKKHADDTFKVNSIIVSAFIKINRIKSVVNLEIQKHIIQETSADYRELKLFLQHFGETKLDFERLIELFEFVVSPSDKIVNGAVYTPQYIREFIVEQAICKSSTPTNRLKIADISCGCGGFLLTTAIKLQKETKKTLVDIFRSQLYGLDIMNYSVERTKILLSLYAIYNNEDRKHYTFNIHVGNALTYNWQTVDLKVRQNKGFDLVLGNPPYVASRNMDAQTLKMAKKMTVSSTGHPDLYIPFFQIGLEQLNKTGLLGYITVNTFIKSINGRALRQYFDDQSVEIQLINFGGEQLFKDRNTYTCICFLWRGDRTIHYHKCSSNLLKSIRSDSFYAYNYSELNHFDGWNLLNSRAIDKFIKDVEAVGRPFKDLFRTKNGIATLKNDVFKFSPVREDRSYYYLELRDTVYPIEKKICRDIINSNKVKTQNDLEKIEKIIFPYTVSNGLVKIILEQKLQSTFPQAYNYLRSQRTLLATRDKGNRQYEVWYAFGRKQSMNVNEYKLFFPHICERPSFVLCKDKDLLFYNGIAIVSEDIQELELVKKLFSTRLFFAYIKATTKAYSSGYISMSRNYLKNFGVYQFSEKEKREFLSCSNPDEYVELKYNLKVPNLIE